VLEELVSNRLKNVTSSKTLAITARTQELKSQGTEIQALSAGELDFPPPPAIIAATKDAIDAGITRYAPVGGSPDLRKAIASYVNAEWKADYKAENVFVGVGAKEVLFLFLQSFVNPGDEVLIPSPYWLSYPEMVTLAGGIPKYIPADPDTLKINTSDLEKAITEKTKIFIFNSPSNPTGIAYDEDEINAIAHTLATKDVLLLSDEIYAPLMYDGKIQKSVVLANERLQQRSFLVGGFSKAFAMTGFRLGFGLGPKLFPATLKKIQSHSTSGTAAFIQAGAVKLLEADSSYLTEWKKILTARRDLMMQKLDEIPHLKYRKPDGAFYIFVDVTHYLGKSYGPMEVKTTTDLCQVLLEKGHVAAVPGDPFGSSTHIRLSFAVGEETIAKGVDAIKEVLKVQES